MNYVRTLKNLLMLTLCSAMLSAMLTDDSKEEKKHPETTHILPALSHEEQELIAIIKATDNPGKLGAYLHRAAEKGFLVAVNILLIEKKVPVDYSDIYGTTPLNLAARNGHSACILALLKANANINSKPSDPFQCSSLHEAVQNTHNDCVRILISKKKTLNLSINIVDHWQRTPLHHAVIHNNAEALAELISAGADINRLDQSHRSALYFAAGFHNIDCAKALIIVGASTDFGREANLGIQAWVNNVAHKLRQELEKKAHS